MYTKFKEFFSSTSKKFCDFCLETLNFILSFFKFFHVSLNFLQTYIIFLFSFLFFIHFAIVHGEKQDSITLLQSKPIIKKRVNYPVPTHKILTKNTHWNHLLPCGVYFNEQKELKKALQCVNKKVYPDKRISSETIAPRCFIISSSSPDVYSSNGVNFIPLVSMLGKASILGYFNTESETLFVVENMDAASIYRHELQHYFLKLKGGTGGGHYQNIWKQCEPPYYKSSDKVKILNKLEKLEKLEERNRLMK